MSDPTNEEIAEAAKLLDEEMSGGPMVSAEDSLARILKKERLLVLGGLVKSFRAQKSYLVGDIEYLDREEALMLLTMAEYQVERSR